MRRWRRFRDDDSSSSVDDDDGSDGDDACSPQSWLAAEGSSVAGVQKNSVGLANGSKNFAAWGKILFRSWRRESTVEKSWEPAPKAAAGLLVLYFCEEGRSLASVLSPLGNKDVQSAIGLPNTAALIPCLSV